MLQTKDLSNHGVDKNTGEEEDDDDEEAWYDRMEQAALSQPLANLSISSDTVSFAHFRRNLSEVTEKEAEMAYFDLVQESNIAISDHSFLEESDTVWQQMMRQIVHASNDRSYTTSTGVHNLLKQLTIGRDLELVLVQQWVFSSLPRSIKLLAAVSDVSALSKPLQSIYVDDSMHPSFIGISKFKPESNIIYVTIFSPYQGGYELFVRMCTELLRRELTKYPSCRYIEMCGIEELLNELVVERVKGLYKDYEEGISMYSLEMSASTMKQLHFLVDSLQKHLYTISEIRIEDAELINENWAYKSSHSLSTVSRIPVSNYVFMYECVYLLT